LVSDEQANFVHFEKFSGLLAGRHGPKFVQDLGRTAFGKCVGALYENRIVVCPVNAIEISLPENLAWCV
jgi:hypothetical protein